MKQKKSADEIRQEKMMEEIKRKAGYIEIPSDDELNKRQVKKEKEAKRKEKMSILKKGFFGGLRTIVCTPLSIAFHAVSFVSKGVGYISSFGLIAGAYYLYQSFSALFKGVAFAEIDSFGKAVPFIIFPFIAYSVSVVTEKLWLYLEEKTV